MFYFGILLLRMNLQNIALNALDAIPGSGFTPKPRYKSIDSIASNIIGVRSGHSLCVDILCLVGPLGLEPRTKGL